MEERIERSLLVHHVANYRNSFPYGKLIRTDHKKGPSRRAALSSVVRVSPPNRQWIS
jgi:hypothetical protein